MIWSFCIFATSFTLKIVIIQNKTVNELKFRDRCFLLSMISVYYNSCLICVAMTVIPVSCDNII